MSIDKREGAFDSDEGRQLAEAALRTISLSTAKSSGEQFFRQLVKELALALDVKYVIAGRLVTLEDESPAKDSDAPQANNEGIQTLAVWAGEDWISNIRYSLRGTPCANVTSQDMCFHPCGVQQDYPHDHLLTEMGAQSYIGMPMVGSEGKTLGILVALDTREISEGKRLLALSLLSIFAARSAVELQHQDHVAGLEAHVKARTEELSSATRRLVEQEKLAALGGFVAGFAHEINTPIGIAVTAASGMEEFARSLKRKLNGEKVSRIELQALADNLESGANLVNSNLSRAAGLISSFKMLAVDQANEEESRLDLRDYLRQLIVAHQPVLRSAHTEVQLDAPEPLRVTMAAGLFSQIISNLIVNTLTHAFDEPLERSLEELQDLKEEENIVALPQRRIDIALHAEGGQLHLHFGDNGRGVSPTVARRLFEPYFTTRRGQGGTGLGLHIVNSLCQRMGGSISIDPHHHPGLGFLIELPLRP